MQPALSLRNRPQTYKAFAVYYFDRAGGVTARGIFSEKTPTLLPGSVRTECVGVMNSRRGYGPAAKALQRMLGWPEEYTRFKF